MELGVGTLNIVSEFEAYSKHIAFLLLNELKVGCDTYADVKRNLKLFKRDLVFKYGKSTVVMALIDQVYIAFEYELNKLKVSKSNNVVFKVHICNENKIDLDLFLEDLREKFNLNADENESIS